MGIWDSILGGGIKGVAEGIGTLAKDIRAAITGEAVLDAAQQAQLLTQMKALEAAALKAASDYDTIQMEGQIAIQKLEAASQDKYVTRGRPTVMWVCCFGLAYTFIVRPLLPWVVEVAAILTGWKSVIPKLPEIATEELLVLLGGLLGLGTMRSVEKIKGVR